MFKGKLIGVLEVQEARGDRMCQDALQELKTAIKASGEHKQRILIHIAVDGLKIRDEKTGVRHLFYNTFYRHWADSLTLVRAANSKLLGTKILELPKTFRVQT